MSSKYNIHSLIEVNLAPDISADLKKSIDFQMSYFGRGNDGEAAPFCINIAPFSSFTPSCRFDLFHLVKGVNKKIYYDPANNLALERTDKGFDIYADTANFIINQFLQFLLLEKGVSFIHSAAVMDAHGNIVLLPGPGGVGKTALVGELVKNHNYKLLGDDLVFITEKGEALSFPRSFVIKEYHRSVYPDLFKKLGLDESSGPDAGARLGRSLRNNSLTRAIGNSVLRWMNISVNPPEETAPALANVPITDIFESDKIVDSGAVKKIVFMQAHDDDAFKIAEIDPDDLCDRMFSIINHEWVGAARMLFSLGAMGLIDLAGYYSRTRSVMMQAVQGKSLRFLSVPAGVLPADLADKFVESCGE